MDKVLKTRSITGIIFGIVVIGLLLLGKIGLLVLCATVGIIGIHEYHTITKKGGIHWLIGIIVFLLLLYMGFYIPQTTEAKNIFLGMTLVIYGFFILNVISPIRINHSKYLPAISIIYPGMSVTLPFMFGNDHIWEANIWFYVFILIWISDVGAYLVGRKIGKTKLIPAVSPGKSVEGALGAGLFTLIAAIIISNFTSFGNIGFWIFCAIFVWIFGTLGDLYESTIKRKYEVKDSGNLLPGHGGFLDRFDSFIFLVPFILLLLKLYQFV
jgi:phosphatidate cytidylyltransferase